jgi:hypothetical protein
VLRLRISAVKNAAARWAARGPACSTMAGSLTPETGISGAGNVEIAVMGWPPAWPNQSVITSFITD